MSKLLGFAPWALASVIFMVALLLLLWLVKSYHII